MYVCSSDKFPKFHPKIFLLDAYLAYTGTSVVAFAVNVCASCEKMEITQELKTSSKGAMRSGRLNAKEHTLPGTTTTGSHNPDIFPTAETFDEFTGKILTDNEWSQFEGLQF